MRSILHILTQPGAEIIGMIEGQKAETEVRIDVVNIRDSDVVDYDQLLGQIFAADSVQVW